MEIPLKIGKFLKKFLEKQTDVRPTSIVCRNTVEDVRPTALQNQTEKL